MQKHTLICDAYRVRADKMLETDKLIGDRRGKVERKKFEQDLNKIVIDFRAQEAGHGEEELQDEDRQEEGLGALAYASISE